MNYQEQAFKQPFLFPSMTKNVIGNKTSGGLRLVVSTVQNTTIKSIDHHISLYSSYHRCFHDTPSL